MMQKERAGSQFQGVFEGDGSCCRYLLPEGRPCWLLVHMFYMAFCLLFVLRYAVEMISEKEDGGW
jgi:hypothetical protein